ncbi:PKD domain-containing protein [Patescibacteria group bacterium]|nr:PKD domain-containing protein [Patescibacteria group bacterium]
MKKIKRLLSKILTIALLLSVVSVSLNFLWADNTAQAGWKDFFKKDEQVTFTNYEGRLAELSEEGYDSALTEYSDLKDFILQVVNFALGFLGLLAVIIVIYGGVLYVTAAGNDDRTETGKKSIIYASVGLLIVMGSFAFVNTIVSSVLSDEGYGVEGGGGQFGFGNFNAMAEELKSSMLDVYSSFDNLVSNVDDYQNIILDANKATLLPINRPQPGEVGAFLRSVNSKMNNIAKSAGNYSVTTLALKGQMRNLELAIDRFENTYWQSDWVKITDGKKIKACKSSRNLLGTESCAEKGYVKQNVSICFYSHWDEYRKQLTGDTTRYVDDSIEDGSSVASKCGPFPSNLGLDFNDSIKNLSESFLHSLDKNLDDIEDIFAKLDRLTVYKESNAYLDYQKLHGALDGATDINLSPNEQANREYTEGLGKNVQDWITLNDVTVEEAGDYLLTALEAYEDLYEFLSNLQSVRVNIKSSVIEGNAPLSAIISVADSSDPAGGTVGINPDKITWDFTGSLTLDQLAEASQDAEGSDSTDSSLIARLVDCSTISTNPAQNSGEEADSAEGIAYEATLANTIKRCVFKKPGTYKVQVVVDSNDPTQYAPGLGFIYIRVNPPATKIDLSIRVNEDGQERRIPILKYSGETIIDEKNRLTIHSDYVNELTFDASGTEKGQNNAKVTGYKWDFGNGTAHDFSTSNATITVDTNQGTADSQGDAGSEQGYGRFTGGQYTINLQVQNELGQVDSKSFVLRFSDIVAQAQATPKDQGLINSNIILDASRSRASNGAIIRNYAWFIYKNNEDRPTSPTYSGPNYKTVNHKFTSPGIYQIDLIVTSQTGEQGSLIDDEGIMTYTITSENPLAIFSKKIENLSQPSTVLMDASRSYDPDSIEDQTTLTYNWTIDGVALNGVSCTRDPEDGLIGCSGNTDFEKFALIEGPYQQDNTDSLGRAGKLVVRFKTKGEHKIDLIVNSTTVDENGQVSAIETSKENSQIINIDNILDIDLAVDPVATSYNSELDPPAGNPMVFTIQSLGAAAFEIDYGDGQKDSGEINEIATTTHSYRQAGKYKVSAIVYDEEDNDNRLMRTVFVSNGEDPLSVISLLVNGGEADLSAARNQETPLAVLRSDQLLFDAGRSINIDGSARNLNYVWSLGGTKTSYQKIVNHQYEDLNDLVTISLKVSDKNDTNIRDDQGDEIYLTIQNATPSFSSIQAVPASENSDLITPTTFTLRAYNPTDADGQIVKYKWWYFKQGNPEDKNGTQVSNTPTAKMTVGSSGAPDEEVTYIFGLEITDQDGATFSNEEECATATSTNPIPGCAIVTVTNGPNETPKAKFNVDKVKINVGEPITFTSASTDSDGSIVNYLWDVLGEGFASENVEDTGTTPSLVYTYTQKNLDGYVVRLKVRDDADTPAVSDPVKIYVDSLAEAPNASFTFEATEVGEGKRVQFTSTSTADENNGAYVSRYKWDFDTDSARIEADLDGDGDKTNDTNSSEANPIYTFAENDTYKVRLTITDNEGNEDEVIREVKVPLADPPTAAFTYEYNGSEIIFTSTSTADEDADATIAEYIWDFDTASILTDSDSNGDGDKANDKDSEIANPTHLYTIPGTYKAKLTVLDSQGNEASVINDIKITQAPPQPLVAAFTYTVLPDKTIQFENNSRTIAGSRITEYVWDFDTASPEPNADSNGDGNKSNDADSRLKDPKHKFISTGKYRVKLTVTDSKGNVDDVTNDVGENVTPPVVDNQNWGDGLQTGILPEDAATDTGLYGVFLTDPAPNADDIVMLQGTSGTVTFDFSQSQGDIAYYIIDKNIYFDTNGDGIRDNDEDFKTRLPGRWTTNFEKAWGRTVAKLTIQDIYGNIDALIQEIQFK